MARRSPGVTLIPLPLLSRPIPRFMKKFFYFFAVTLLFFLIQGVQAVEIRPTRQTAVVNPGETQKLFLEVKNDSSEPRRFRAQIDSFQINEETGNLEFNTGDEAVGWVKPDVSTLSLDPGEEGQFIFALTAPKSAAPGAHYLVFFATEEASSGQIALSGRIGSLVFLNVSGEVVEKVDLDDFSVLQSLSVKALPTLHMFLRNSGNIHVVPTGEIIVSNFLGQLVATVPINEKNEKILAEGRWRRQFVTDLTWKDAGKLRAHVTIHYGLQDQIITRDVSFWYLPLPVILFGGAGFFILLGIGIFILKKKTKL